MESAHICPMLPSTADNLNFVKTDLNIGGDMSVEKPDYLDMKNIATLDDLQGLITTLFLTNKNQPAEVLIDEYVKEVVASLANHPQRTENPAYLQMYARTMVQAAEYGFTLCLGHQNLHYKSDFTHPVALIATASYLGHINTQMITQRREIYDKYFYNKPRLSTAYLFGEYVMPQKGAVLFREQYINRKKRQAFIDTASGRRKSALDNRQIFGQPIIIGDYDFNVKASRIGVRSGDAHTSHILAPLQINRYSYSDFEVDLPAISDTFSWLTKEEILSVFEELNQ